MQTLQSLFAKPLQLLVVEDSEPDFILLKKHLNKSAISIAEIVRAESVNDVKELQHTDSFDLIFLDLSLPDSEGIDSFNAVKTLIPQTPLIVLSGMADMKIAVSAIGLGAQDYLVKGEFDEKLLTKTMRYSIERNKILSNLKYLNDKHELFSKAANDILVEWDIHTNDFIWTYKNQEHRTTLQKFIQLLHPDEQEQFLNSLTQTVTDRETMIFIEFRMLPYNETAYRHFYARAYFMLNDRSEPYKMIGTITDITERIKFQQKLALQQIHQQKLITEATIQAQEQERNVLGKELHDNINQVLTTVKMYLEMFLNQQPEKNELIEKSYKNLTLSIEEIRNLSHALVTPILDDIGLADALQELAEEACFGRKIIFQNNISIAHEEKLNKDVRLMIYRIVQEQLNNIVKYAEATKITITLQTKNDITLIIQDNGIGFNPQQKAKGIGLKNIQSRVEFYAGELHILSAPGKGCSLMIKIPFTESTYS